MSGPGLQPLSRESLEGLLAGARSSLDRMPLLRTALEQAGTTCAEEMRNQLAVPVRLVLQDVRNGSAGEVLRAHNGTGAIGLLAAPGWDAQLVVSAERDAVYTLTDVLLGSDGSQSAYMEDRPLSAIETNLAGVFFAGLGKSLATAFAGLAETEMVLEGSSGKVDFDVIPADRAMVAARYRFDALGRGGEVSIAIPQAAVNAMAKVLTEPANKAPEVPPDKHWTAKIQQELTRASVTLTATLEERPGVLGAFANLEVGQIIPLEATAQSRLQVECNGERLMWCHLGKSNGYYTLRVDSFVDREQEFMNDILAA